jgi:phosphoribosylanthranilate isomerase
MSGIKLKVCGMKMNTSEVASLRPDYLGFIFYEKSPRFFNSEIPVLSSGISKVGVFVNASIEEILEITNKYKLDVVQLHGEESPEFCKRLGEYFRNESIEVEVPAISEVEKPAMSPSTSLRIKSVEVPVLPVLSAVEVSAVEVSAVEVPALSAVEVPALSAVEVPALSAVEVWKVFGIKDSFNFEVLEAYENVVDKFLFDTKGKEKGGNGYTFNWEVLNEYSSTKPFVLSGGIGLEEIKELKTLLKTKLPLYAIDVNSKFETEPGLKNIDDLKELKLSLKSISD